MVKVSRSGTIILDRLHSAQGPLGLPGRPGEKGDSGVSGSSVS